jgi:hypothetical protein
VNRCQLYIKHSGARRAWRGERPNLERLLDAAWDNDSPLTPRFDPLHRRSLQHTPVVATLQYAEVTRRLTQPLATLARSYLHMHANRLLRSAQRAQELVFYDFLDRHYGSLLARARKSKGFGNKMGTFITK